MATPSSDYSFDYSLRVRLFGVHVLLPQPIARRGRHRSVLHPTSLQGPTPSRLCQDRGGTNTGRHTGTCPEVGRTFGHPLTLVPPTRETSVGSLAGSHSVRTVSSSAWFLPSLIGRLTCPHLSFSERRPVLAYLTLGPNDETIRPQRGGSGVLFPLSLDVLHETPCVRTPPPIVSANPTPGTAIP